MIGKLVIGSVTILVFALGYSLIALSHFLNEPHVPGYVRISGEVKNPGQFLIPGTSNMIDFGEAIELAGGYAEMANRTRIEVVRGQKRIPINALRMDKFDSERLTLHPGDDVIVSRTSGVPRGN